MSYSQYLYTVIHCLTVSVLILQPLFSIKHLKEKSRHDCDLSMQGCKSARGETREGSSLARTGGVDADTNITTYKRPGDTSHKQQILPSTQPTTTTKAEDTPQHEIPPNRVPIPLNTSFKTGYRECLKCGEISYVKSMLWKLLVWYSKRVGPSLAANCENSAVKCKGGDQVWTWNRLLINRGSTYSGCPLNSSTLLSISSSPPPSHHTYPDIPRYASR